MSEIIKSSLDQVFSQGISERQLLIIRLVDEYIDSIQKRVEVSFKLNLLPDEFLNYIKDCSADRDLLRFVLENIDDDDFVSNVAYRKYKLLFKYYVKRYRDLSDFKFNDL